MTLIGNLIYSFLNKKWWFDKFYNEFLIQNIISFGYQVSYKSIDRGVIEILGPYGISNLVFSVAFNLNKLHTGYIYHYAIYMIFNLIFIVVFIFSVQLFIFDVRLLMLFLTFFI